MARGTTYEDLCSKLMEELGKQTPLSEEDRKYLDALNAWNQKIKQLNKPVNGNRPTKLEIETLALHIASRPKRKPGRPRKALPPRRVIEDHLTQYLADLALKNLPVDTDALLKVVTKKILLDIIPA